MTSEKPCEHSYTIRIDKEGNWYYNDLPIINQTILRLFNQHIVGDQNTGYALRIGAESCRLAVEDTPYVVRAVEFCAARGGSGDFFRIQLNDETREELDPATLVIGKDHVPYCRVKNGLFPARFLRPAYYQLARHIEQDEQREDRFYFLINNKRIYITFDTPS